MGISWMALIIGIIATDAHAVGSTVRKFAQISTNRLSTERRGDPRSSEL
jgi:hypothetical protein